MYEFVLIMLNMFENVCIYLNKQSSEYGSIPNVSDATHSISSLYKLLISYRDTDVFGTLSKI